MPTRKSPTVSRVAAAMTLALTLAVTAAGSACGTGGAAECSCFLPGARIHVAQESAAAVTSVRLSGAACDGVATTCAQASPLGCATYSFSPKGPGACVVDVIFLDSTFTAKVTFNQTTGCCAGLYPSPASAGDIDAVHAPADAGGGG